MDREEDKLIFFQIMSFTAQSIQQIAAELLILQEKAHSGVLSEADLAGGTFTLVLTDALRNSLSHAHMSHHITSH